jgi:hypothetical protein
VVGHGDHLDEDLAHLSTADELEGLVRDPGERGVGRIDVRLGVADRRRAEEKPGSPSQPELVASH